MPPTHDRRDQCFAGLAVIFQRQYVSAHKLVGAVAPPDLFASRPRGLALRKLAPWLAVVFLELVGTIERRRVDRCIEVHTDAEPVDGCFRRHHRLQHVLVNAATHQNDDILEPAGIKDVAHFPRHRRQIAAVDAHAADCDAVRLEFGRELHDFPRPGLGVVGIDQQHNPFGTRAGKILECGHFVVVHLHERMRHGANHRDSVVLAGEHIGGAGKPCDVAGACREKAGLGAVGGPQPEI